LKNQIPQNIHHNLLFLIAEVSSQITNLQTYFLVPSAITANNISERNSYIANLAVRVQNETHNHVSLYKIDSLVFRAINTIVCNLAHIALLCCDCIKHSAMMIVQDCLQVPEYQRVLKQVLWAIGLIDGAIVENSTQLALRIAGVEQDIQEICTQLIEGYIVDLKYKDNIEDLISALFVARSIEHMGDALLNMSESLISGNLGQTVNIEHYQSLNGFFKQLRETENQELAVKTLAETRSGCTISKISKTKHYNDNILAIFKNGKKRKLQEERESVAIWHKIYPGIAPKILSYNVQGESAALLIEHLEGTTFESLLLNKSRKLQNAALNRLCQTLKEIWKITRNKKVVHAHYMGQLKRRMTEVYRIHPDFKHATCQISHLTMLEFDALVKKAEGYEKMLSCCFSVYIHGDFNSDNIIYEPMSNKINFIDLHRSCYMDYVQDVSVFMVSNYRLQVLDKTIARRVLEITLSFYQFVAEFAKANGDKHFELRLALGLARSFATSTRFILDKTLADAMFMRSRYLIEQVLSIMDSHETDEYRVPIREIFVG
jgi:Ser/Thr protein kinase RdoA (MazF antagonist)